MHKLGKQPEERQSSSPAGSGQSGSPKEKPMLAYERASGNIKPREAGTPLPRDTVLKGEPS